MRSGITLLTYRKGHTEDILLDTWMFSKDAHTDSDEDDDDTNSNVTRGDFITDGKYDADKN